MAGRKQFDEQEVLRAVMLTFWEHGYARTGLDEVGTATGLGRGSLYGAYGSKDGMFRAALRAYVDRYGVRYERAVAARADDPVAAVRAFLDVALARLADPTVPRGCLLVQTVADPGALEPGTARLAGELLERQHARLAAVLGAHAPARVADDLARHVATVNQGLAVMHRGGVGVQELRSVVGTACTLVAAVVLAGGG